MSERYADPQFQPLAPPPAPLPDDDAEVIRQAVEAACVSDFDFFRAAWRAWHGTPPEEKALERIFVAYLFHQRAPGFARHFARRVLEAEAAGDLDSAALGLKGLRPVRRPRAYVHPIENLTAYALLALCLLPFI